MERKRLTGGDMKLEVDNERCNGCGVCMRVCPFGAIELRENKVHITDGCIVCGYCVSRCPAFALSINSSIAERRRDAYV